MSLHSLRILRPIEISNRHAKCRIRFSAGIGLDGLGCGRNDPAKFTWSHHFVTVGWGCDRLEPGPRLSYGRQLAFISRTALHERR
ncbi:hypothetical protein PHAMO_190100 [Magnetospirillum molischianum DSM 120]|uniref:Uncharacterized protein n=1 Tax=Magnetospirillum molischianum DSM 120 TaxID=1150626 RepID=H8FPK3_MAGML|nr:hypothetical protein PHAMO_190100 [Magnetospirillum molischianum DSM 120]